MATKNPFLQRRPGHTRRSRMRGPTYPAKPGPLFCWLCGAPLESSAYWFRSDPPDIVFAKEEWYAAWKRYKSHRSLRRQKFSLSVPASHLADSLGSKTEWVDLFRMIMFSKNDKWLPQGYHLSGIGYTPGARTLKGKYILSLRDPTAACIGLTKENSNALQVSPVPHPFVPREFDDSSSLEGYLIHSRCWDLIEHHIGPVAGYKLELLVAALQKQWDDLMPRLLAASKDYSISLHNGPFDRFMAPHLCDKELKCVYAFEDYMHWDNKLKPPLSRHSFEAASPLQDPIFIPELDTLFQSCRQKSSIIVKRSPRQILTLDYRLPLEILLCIADYLTFQELYAMLTAFEEEFPVDYWKRRIPPDLFFELNYVDSESFPWAFFVSEVLSQNLLEESAGLWNRKHIVNLLLPIKESVLRE